MVNITRSFNLDPNTITKLKKLAEHTERTNSAVIRHLVKEEYQRVFETTSLPAPTQPTEGCR